MSAAAMSPKIILIAAMSRNRVIGRGNSLPWDVPEDMKHFRDSTRGQPVLMGRKTFESMPAALPGRLNVVITRQRATFPGAETVGSLQEGIDLICKLKPDAPRIYVTGGAEIYRQALALGMVDQIILTTIDLDVPDGDAFFPEFERGRMPGQFACVQVRESVSQNPSQRYEWFERVRQ